MNVAGITGSEQETKADIQGLAVRMCQDVRTSGFFCPSFLDASVCARSTLASPVHCLRSCGLLQFRSARRGMLMARSLMSSCPGHLLPTDRQLLTMPCRPCFLSPESAKDRDAANEGQRYASRFRAGPRAML